MERENREEGERVSDNKRWAAISPICYRYESFFLSHVFQFSEGGGLCNVEQLGCEEGG